MKVYNIVFSPTGGTRKVAEIVSKELSDEIKTIDLTEFNTDFSKYQLEENDVAVISMPSYGGRCPQVAIERLKQIKPNNAKAVLISVYGNRADEDTLVELYDVSKELGFNVIAGISAVAEHSIVRLYGANRPDELDVEQLKEFVSIIKIRITDNLKLELSGNRPYKKLAKFGLIPKTTKSCVDCKKCAKLCPTGAICSENVKKIDKLKCISCMRCVSVCPHSAKRINKIMLAIITFMLKKVCSERKENKLF